MEKENVHVHLNAKNSSSTQIFKTNILRTVNLTLFWLGHLDLIKIQRLENALTSLYYIFLTYVKNKTELTPEKALSIVKKNNYKYSRNQNYIY